MEKVIRFLTELGKNNNKAWFDAHKGEYLAAKVEFESFVGELIAGISSFDKTLGWLEVKDCVYRIYRDVRFSKDKAPYKTHMGAYVVRGGKNSGYAGYYFHVEPVSDGMIGGNILAAGLYCPEPAVLKSVREDICYNGGAFLEAVSAAGGFDFDRTRWLKKVPAGFPADSPMAEYLKIREEISLYRNFGNDFMLAPGLPERTVAEFSKTADYVQWLNRAIDYAREEMRQAGAVSGR